MKKIFNLVILSIFILSISACEKQSWFTSDAAKISKAGSLARFVIVGNWLYTISHQSLRTYDLTKVANPKLTSEIQVGPNIETLFPFNNNLFVGSNQAMYVYNLTNPGKPSPVSSVGYVIRGRDPVVANELMAFSTVRNLNNIGGVLNVLDIRQPTNPFIVNIENMQEPYGLGLAGNTLYVCEGTFGLKSYDISQSSTNAGEIKLSGQVVTGDKFLDVIPVYPLLYTYIAGGFSIFEISNPAKPQILSKTTL